MFLKIVCDMPGKIETSRCGCGCVNLKRDYFKGSNVLIHCTYNI